MSPLTKLFVVLLVILSLVTTAATVVFVNKVDNLSGLLTASQTKVAAANTEVQNAQAAAAAQRDLAQETVRRTQAELEQGRQGANQLQQRNNEVSSQLAATTSQLTLQSADLTRVAEALKAAQDAINKKDETITALRTTNDERLKQNVELNTANTDLTATLQVTERERRFLAEQLGESKRTVDRQGAMLRDAGINPKMAVSDGTKAGAPAINGVIRDRRTIAGVPYASISVGSNDGVTRGMEFKVVDRGTGAFLGILTVDSVEPTESTGRLSSGPRLNDIKPGVEVKTQL
ncbi:MAG: hypothetical protein H7Z14_02655 [Anaerolineae bacterium]|nr:hypothetical protein [Phycisphaerae bacterium]